MADDNVGYDPCDEMVTVEQLMMFMVTRHTFAPGDVYSVIASVMGVERDVAKRAVYRECYSG